MGARGVVVLPGQGSVWNISAGRSLVLKLLGGATEGSIMLFEEQQHTQDTIASLSEGEKAEQRQRYGWEIIGPNPL